MAAAEVVVEEGGLEVRQQTAAVVAAVILVPGETELTAPELGVEFLEMEEALRRQPGLAAAAVVVLGLGRTDLLEALLISVVQGEPGEALLLGREGLGAVEELEGMRQVTQAVVAAVARGALGLQEQEELEVLVAVAAVAASEMELELEDSLTDLAVAAVAAEKVLVVAQEK
jgi:hypothetical protein